MQASRAILPVNVATLPYNTSLIETDGTADLPATLSDSCPSSIRKYLTNTPTEVYSKKLVQLAFAPGLVHGGLAVNAVRMATDSRVNGMAVAVTCYSGVCACFDLGTSGFYDFSPSSGDIPINATQTYIIVYSNVTTPADGPENKGSLKVMMKASSTVESFSSSKYSTFFQLTHQKFPLSNLPPNNTGFYN